MRVFESSTRAGHEDLVPEPCANLRLPLPIGGRAGGRLASAKSNPCCRGRESGPLSPQLPRKERLLRRRFTSPRCRPWRLRRFTTLALALTRPTRDRCGRNETDAQVSRAGWLPSRSRRTRATARASGGVRDSRGTAPKSVATTVRESARARRCPDAGEAGLRTDE